jgi:ABC-type branched-subunit amino acid transport system ATPase component/ABC-type branched-subunit amino acid transport system permease subunit
MRSHAARLGLVLLLAGAFAACWAGSGYQRYLVGLIGLTTTVGVGLNVLLGLTGEVSLGHVGFFAIGAYVVGILTTATVVGFWPALVAAALVGGAVGGLLALPALRVRGPYLAMITIAFGFIVENGTIEWRDLTGGANGLMNIPSPAWFGHAFGEREVAALAVLVGALALGLFARLSASPWGLAMRAVKDSEIAARSIGLGPVVIRSVAFVLSAAVTAVAGGVFAPLTGYIGPSAFPFSQSILFLLVVIIGGAGSVLGPLAGALVVVLLPEFLSGFAEYRLLLFGGLLLVVLWLAPEGIVGALAQLLRRRAAPPPVLQPAGAALTAAAADGGLEARGLAIAFGGVQAVADVDFAARPGVITSLIGPNGAGKTTLLNLVGGFYRPDRGTISLGGRDLTGAPAHRLARAGIARTYQTTQLFGSLSVLDNVTLGRRRGRLGVGALLRGGARAEVEAAAALLGFVGYRGALDRRADALPHVDRRLVEIARALATRPQVLLLDEPAAGLSHGDTATLGRLLRAVADAGIAVVLVEHDMNLVMSISDHVVVLDAGRRIAAGAPAAVRRDPAVRRAYLGDDGLAARPRATPLPAGEPVLAVADLRAGYGAIPVLEAIGLAVGPGELVAVLGANGAGKSTLMRALSGLLRPVTGSIRLLGGELGALPAHAIARRGLALVPEGRQLFPHLSVLDNLRLGALRRRDVDPERELPALLARFPALAVRRHALAGLLSGGEQQMLAIARGLIARPAILLLDEPSLGLAPSLINTLFEIVAELRDDGTTLLLVDQMAALALAVADRGYVLEGGRIVHQGRPAELARDSALEQAYLGATPSGG